MGGVNVKITMVERVLHMLAPHLCFGCGKIATTVCADCKYDIIHEPFVGCILCNAYTPDGICSKHATSISHSFTIGVRTGVLETIINRLKFNNVKSAARSLAELMDEALPCLPPDALYTTIPTVASHIRQRGYDHMKLIGTHFGALRGLNVDTLLVRRNTTTQHLVGRVRRYEQAGEAFELTRDAQLNGRLVVLIDDIVTTGATLQAAASVLARAGATVWCVTLAYQPLD